jgi:hypothetical protein
MKVDDPKVLLHPRLGGPTSRGAEPPDPLAADAEERIEGPELDRMVALLKLELGPVDVVREGRVSEMRAVLAAGRYRADVHDVARNVLREQLAQLLA